jgi:hypothetical protein
MKKLTGIVAKRKELASKVNNVTIKVSPHNRYQKLHEERFGYIVCPITTVVDLTVEIRYTVLQVLPLGSTPFGIVESMFDEWGAPQFSDYGFKNWMEPDTLKCFYRGEVKFLTHVGPVMSNSEDAIRWSQLCAKQLVLNNELAKKKLVTHLLGIKKILHDEM